MVKSKTDINSTREMKVVSFRKLGIWEKEDFFKIQTIEYGDSMHKAGFFPTEVEARQHAVDSLRGLRAENSNEKPHFYWFLDFEGKDVGYLWVAENTNFKTAYIYQISLFEKYRRQGFARAALHKLSVDCKAKGIVSINLNVFAYNGGARALYQELGFKDAATAMRLLL